MEPGTSSEFAVSGYSRQKIKRASRTTGLVLGKKSRSGSKMLSARAMRAGPLHTTVFESGWSMKSNAGIREGPIAAHVMEHWAEIRESLPVRNGNTRSAISMSSGAPQSIRRIDEYFRPSLAHASLCFCTALGQLSIIPAGAMSDLRTPAPVADRREEPT